MDLGPGNTAEATTVVMQLVLTRRFSLILPLVRCVRDWTVFAVKFHLISTYLL